MSSRKSHPRIAAALLAIGVVLPVVFSTTANAVNECNATGYTLTSQYGPYTNAGKVPAACDRIGSESKAYIVGSSGAYNYKYMNRANPVANVYYATPVHPDSVTVSQWRGCAHDDAIATCVYGAWLPGGSAVRTY